MMEGSDVDAKVERARSRSEASSRDVKAEILRLLGPGRVGSFRARKLSVEEGGQLDGDFEIGEPQLLAKRRLRETGADHADERRESPGDGHPSHPACGRSVKVLGRVRRVLCACGQILMEIGGRRPVTAPAEVVEAG
jgi:hypothetical protein